MRVVLLCVCFVCVLCVCALCVCALCVWRARVAERAVSVGAIMGERLLREERPRRGSGSTSMGQQRRRDDSNETWRPAEWADEKCRATVFSKARSSGPLCVSGHRSDPQHKLLETALRSRRLVRSTSTSITRPYPHCLPTIARWAAATARRIRNPG